MSAFVVFQMFNCYRTKILFHGIFPPFLPWPISYWSTGCTCHRLARGGARLSPKLGQANSYCYDKYHHWLSVSRGLSNTVAIELDQMPIRLKLKFWNESLTISILKLLHHLWDWKSTSPDINVTSSYHVREGPLICALFEIRTTFKFRWVGGLKIRGRSN